MTEKEATILAAPFVLVFLSTQVDNVELREEGGLLVVQQKQPGWALWIDLASRKVVKLGHLNPGMRFHTSKGCSAMIWSGLVTMFSLGRIQPPIVDEYTTNGMIVLIFTTKPEASDDLLHRAMEARRLVEEECGRRGLTLGNSHLSLLEDGFCCCRRGVFTAKIWQGQLVSFELDTPSDGNQRSVGG